MYTVCPHCGAINRVPASRPAGQAKCGSCHRPLFEGKPLAVTAEAFERHLARDEVPLLVDFWAAWCGPCRMVAPEVAKVAQRLAGRALVLKVDTDARAELAQRYQIRSIPTLAVFERGREARRAAGAQSAAAIEQFVMQSAAA